MSDYDADTEGLRSFRKGVGAVPEGEPPDIDLIANAPADLAALLGDAEKLNEVREFHRNWGDQDTDTLDGLDLWEQLGRLLGVTP